MKIKTFCNLFCYLSFATPAFFLPSLASAHEIAGPNSGILAGIHHPIHGLDHILAMVAVGIWATQLGRKNLWSAPLSFLAMMVGGGLLGLLGVTLPFIEETIALSVLLFGVLIAASIQLPRTTSIILVGLFAIFHGHAHGVEMPVSSSPLFYMGGFLLSTAFLHIIGIFVSLIIYSFKKDYLLRYAGVAMGISGLLLY